MEIVLWLVIGIVAGCSARWLMPGPRAGGMGVAIAVGIGGALIGGLFVMFAMNEPANGVDLRSLLMAVAGSLVLLISYRSLALRLDDEENRLRTPMR